MIMEFSMNPKLGDLIYKGKAKDVYKTNDQNEVIVKFRNDITAGDGVKTETLDKKGVYNSIISSKLFEILEDAGIKTQYIKLIKPGYMLCKKLDMIPLEVITRNIAAGSLIRKFPFKENQELNPPIIQMDYKNDEYHDPMLNDSIIIALELASQLEKVNYHVYYPEDKLNRDWELLKNWHSTTNSINSTSRLGMKLCEQFFPNFYHIEDNKGRSFENQWNEENFPATF